MIKKTMTLIAAAAFALVLITPVTIVKAEETVTVVFNAPKKSALEKAAKKFIKEANKLLAGEIKLKRVKKVKIKKKLKKVASDKNAAKAAKKSLADIVIVSSDMAKAVRKPSVFSRCPGWSQIQLKLKCFMTRRLVFSVKLSVQRAAVSSNLLVR